MRVLEMLERQLAENFGVAVIKQKFWYNINYRVLVPTAILAFVLGLAPLWWIFYRPVTLDQLDVLSVIIEKHADSTGQDPVATLNKICMKFEVKNEYELNQAKYRSALALLTFSIEPNVKLQHASRGRLASTAYTGRTH